MTQALQLLVCIAVAALIGFVALIVDRWEKSHEGLKKDKRQDSFIFHGPPSHTEEPDIRKGAAMSRIG